MINEKHLTDQFLAGKTIYPADIPGAIEKAKEYSDHPERLEEFLKTISIACVYKGIDTQSKYRRLTVDVYIKKLPGMIVKAQYPFHFSHIDAQAFRSDITPGEYYLQTIGRTNQRIEKDFRKDQQKARINFFESMLYNILCCIALDCRIPEDFNEFCSEYGYNDDSIKDQKLHFECLQLSRQLENVVYSDDALECLPA